MKGALNGLDLGKFKTWLIVGAAAAVLLLLSGTLWSGSGGTGGSQSSPTVPAISTGATSPQPSGGGGGQDLLAYQKALAQQVASSLSAIRGAGSVTVSLDLRSGPSYLYAFNQTTRKTETSTGTTGTTTDTTNDTQLATAGSAQSPVLTQEVAPRVVGVLVVASGAQNPLVRQELSQAAQSLLGLPAYEVEVLPGGGSK